tara:strand:+ start:6320 stop:7474 length:1155 start_codon:yes stop_codon:yes gene_type:complete
VKPRLIVIVSAALLVLIVMVRLAGKRTSDAPEASNAGTDPSPAPPAAAASPDPASSKVHSKPGTAQAPVNAESSEKKKDAVTLAKLVEGLFSGEISPKQPTPEQLKAHVESNQNSAESMLAAFQASGDKAWLSNAALLHPDDPRVQFAMITQKVDPERQREWLEKFKASDPENSLADYLSAAEHLRRGDSKAAIADMLAAEGKRNFEDYARSDIQSAEELYLNSGRDPTESKVSAAIQQKLPYLKDLRRFGHQLSGLQKQALENGDTAAHAELVQAGLGLGQRLSSEIGGKFLLNNVVGIAIEREVLHGLEPDQGYDYLEQTPREALGLLDEEMNNIKNTAKITGVIGQVPSFDVAGFFDRIKLYGEYDALRWLSAKYASTLNP